MIKMIAAFVGGALAGAGASYILAKVVISKNMENAVEERVEAVRGNYEALYSRKQQKMEENDEIEETEQEEAPLTQKIIGATTLKYADRSVSNLVEDLQYGSPPEEDTYNASPVIISEERFSEERMNYSKRSVTYWEQDSMLTDEDYDTDGPMDISQTVGYQALDEFRKDPELEEIFVRNDRLGEDYYIVRSRVPFSEVEPNES